jgi:cholesterol oxidase
MSLGVAGGAGIYVDENTHIEAARFPEGSDAIGLLMTLLCAGRPGWSRILTWLGTMLRHPLAALRAHNPFGFARNTLLLLVMQTGKDPHLNFRLRRRWYWPFSMKLVTEAGPTPIPTVIPEGIEFATRAAQELGGVATALQGEILFNLPSTAHLLGGCAMADSPARGVVDVRGRVFGYRNLMVCDGSVVGANLGVNPSLTITALAEYLMSQVPTKQ